MAKSTHGRLGGPHWRFALFFLAAQVAFLGALLPTLWSWEPFDGADTRVSGLPEVDYGWNAPQRFYARRHYRVVERLEDYDQPYEIVVVGDSYSCRYVYQEWLDFFVDAVDASVLCIWTGDALDVEALAKHPIYRATPPRLVIFESVERSLVPRLMRFADHASSTATVAAEVVAPPLPLRPRRFEMVERSRPVEISVLDRIREVAATTQTRLGLRLEADRVHVVPLKAEPALFSSRRSRELLVLDLESPKSAVPEGAVAQAASAVPRMRALVQANRRTSFLLLAFPDKSSLYAPYLASPQDQTPNLIAALAAHVPLIRLDEVLRAALARGAIDLFLPNDSHLGSEGGALAAEAVIARLLQAGVLAPRAAEGKSKPPAG